MHKTTDEPKARPDVGCTELLGCPFCHKPGLEVEDGNVTCATRYCALWCVRIPRLAWQTRSEPNKEVDRDE